MSSNLIPQAEYRAVAVPVSIDGADTWVQFGETKKGDPQVAVQFAILDGPQAGRRAVWFGYFTADTIARTIESLRRCGFKGDDLAKLPFQRINQEVSIVVEHNTWEGKTTARVAWVNAAGGGGLKLAKPLSGPALGIFAAKMKRHVTAVAEVAGPAATPPAPGAVAAPSGEAPAAPPEPAGDAWASYGGQSSEDQPPPRDDDSGIPF